VIRDEVAIVGSRPEASCCQVPAVLGPISSLTVKRVFDSDNAQVHWTGSREPSSLWIFSMSGTPVFVVTFRSLCAGWWSWWPSLSDDNSSGVYPNWRRLVWPTTYVTFAATDMFPVRESESGGNCSSEWRPQVADGTRGLG
jgi:hypothetical protein